MDLVRLGRSGLRVSRIGLGTMNFGSQLSEAESHAVLDAAFDAGINFIDTAEMYASPPSAETYGLSERIVGSWLARQPRERVILASKIVGPPDGLFQSGAYIRGGTTTFDRHHLARAVDGSLKRLGTDYIDLYQFHWPDRLTPLETQLDAVSRLVEDGKIRYFGVSNETPWGLTRMVAAAERPGAVAPVSTQNVLNLIEHQEYDNLAETCLRERVGFIAFSPLAMGLLSGKYAGGQLPEGSRFARFERYRNKYAAHGFHERVQGFSDSARAAGVSLAQYAFAWVLRQPGVSVMLSSASNLDQLRTMLSAASLEIDFK